MPFVILGEEIEVVELVIENIIFEPSSYERYVANNTNITCTAKAQVKPIVMLNGSAIGTQHHSLSLSLLYLPNIGIFCKPYVHVKPYVKRE